MLTLEEGETWGEKETPMVPLLQPETVTEPEPEMLIVAEPERELVTEGVPELLRQEEAEPVGESLREPEPPPVALTVLLAEALPVGLPVLLWLRLRVPEKVPLTQAEAELLGSREGLQAPVLLMLTEEVPTAERVREELPVAQEETVTEGEPAALPVTVGDREALMLAEAQPLTVPEPEAEAQLLA